MNDDSAAMSKNSRTSAVQNSSTTPRRSTAERRAMSQTRRHNSSTAQRTRRQTSATHPTSRSRRSWGDNGGYIPGLDGLRAIAVLAVIVYHAAPGMFPGGFLGVDIFFVISGFLVSTLLLRELRSNGKINLPHFWLRRARRLIPALVVLILVVVPTAAIASRDLLVGIGRQILGALTFSTNWLEIAHGSSYFDSTTPLLFKNFWSLAIEEQFYLLWPLVLIALLALLPRLSVRMGVVAFLGVASAALMAILFDPAHVTRVYYGTDTHLFGLAIGIILAFAWANPMPEKLGTFLTSSRSQLAGLGALALIVVSMFFLNETSAFTFRGGMFLVCLLVAILIAALLTPGSLIARFFENPVLRWFGTRSYGLYLWHWPILVVASVIVPTAVGSPAYWTRTAIAVALTCLVCELSFRLVETPIRREGFRAAFVYLRGTFATTLTTKIIAGISAVLFVATCVLVATAPAKSQTQLMIEAGESAENSTAGTQAGSEPTSVPTEPTPTTSGEATAPTTTTAPGTANGNATNGTGLPPDFNTAVPTNDEITAIGDSMFSASRGGLVGAMPGIDLLAKPNRQWWQGVDVVNEALAAGNVRRVVVIGLGTNAGLKDPSYARQIIDALGNERMILLVNLYSPSTFVDTTNEILQQVADEYPNVTVIDWHSTAYAHPDYLQVDQTHPSLEGAQALGQLIRTSIDEFAAQLAAEAAGGSTN
ncbi:acyltransferase [Arcanobacterium haemolyticum]|nr:acyltransferase [Arcanobacterium haemolyticum]